MSKSRSLRPGTSGTLWYFAAAVTLAAAMMSCGGKGSQPSETAAPAGNPAGKPVDMATAGTVTGSIKLDGAAPRPKNINMAAEPNCAKEHAGSPAQTEEVVPGDGGTLQNVVVYLKGDFSQYSFTPASEPVMIDQKGCQYHPHVLALQTGEPLSVVNSDQTTHNIHPVPKDNREWNESQPPGSSPIMQSFARSEVSIPVKCNVHPWMKAYIAVFNNPYYVVTGKDGSFTIKNVPPGSYTVTAWHELYGSQDQMVTVGPSESKSVTITFKATAAGSD
jgi:plastocyanin